MTNELIFKYLSGQASNREKDEVRVWIAESDARKKEFSRIKNAWILAGLDKEIDPEIKEKEIRRILGKIHFSDQKRSLPIRILKYAAVVTIIVGFSATLGYFISEWQIGQNPNYTEVIVPKGEQSRIVLPDGSKVLLNGDSYLKFASFSHSKMRKVSFKGEGFFQVTHDSSHPFIVETSDFNIKVLGTRFYVSSYPDDSLQTTYLERGKVEIELKEHNNIFLKPSEVFEYERNSGKFQKLTINDTRFTDWTKGILTIKGKTFAEFSKTLERRFNIQIIFGDSEVKNHVYTGSIKDEDLNSVLEAIKFASSINYKRNGRTVTFYSK
jgi:ferric-dicitrate binding protein FerR (iron transport regulator)